MEEKPQVSFDPGSEIAPCLRKAMYARDGESKGPILSDIYLQESNVVFRVEG